MRNAAAEVDTDTDMRVVVKVTAAHPDLHEALQPIPVRKRAERIRTLALIGLTVLANGRQPVASVSAAPPSPTEPALDDRRKRLISRLKT
jgi:hypothetical protein